MKFKQFITVPNLLCYIRIALIPYFAYTYLHADRMTDYLYAAFLLAVMEITDFLDGFIALVNYGIIGLIQLQLGFASGKDLSNDEAIALYDKNMAETRGLMLRKNHDYDEAWRKMRVSSYTDLILMKIMRTKEIEDNQGCAAVSEGINANYMDIVNYAMFGIIKLTEAQTA